MQVTFSYPVALELGEPFGNKKMWGYRIIDVGIFKLFMTVYRLHLFVVIKLSLHWKIHTPIRSVGDSLGGTILLPVLSHFMTGSYG